MTQGEIQQERRVKMFGANYLGKRCEVFGRPAAPSVVAQGRDGFGKRRGVLHHLRADPARHYTDGGRGMDERFSGDTRLHQLPRRGAV